MSKISGFLTRLRRSFRRRAMDQEMLDEMQTHIELETERRIALGEDPTTARRRAAAEFGSVDARTEEIRDNRLGAWLEQCWQDLRLTVRNLGKTPRITATIVLSLALAIGANTAIFSLFNELILRPGPAKNPEELVLLKWESGRKDWKPSSVNASLDGLGFLFSPAMYERLQVDQTVLSGLFATAELPGVGVTVDRQTKTGHFQAVSGNFFRVLGITAFVGRALTPADDTPGAQAVAVVSRRFSQRRFGGDRAALGQTILVNRVATTVVGIMPDSLRPDVFLPLSILAQLQPNQDPADQAQRWSLRLIGRLRPGVTSEQATDRLDLIFREAVRQETTMQIGQTPPRLTSLPGGQRYLEWQRQANLDWLKLMGGMVSLVLLAACANVANLLLARGVARRREISVRLALGASQGRLIRQLLIESGLLALLATALGMLISKWDLALLAMLFPASDPNHEFLMQLPLDLRVVGFTAAIGLLTTLVCGLLPALRATRLDLNVEFHGGTRGLGGGALSRLSQMLVVVQVAVSIVLLIGTGLFARSLETLKSVNFGINQSHLLRFTLDGNGAGYSPEQFAPSISSVTRKVEELPGVRSVSYSGWHILNGSHGSSAPFALPGSSTASGRKHYVTWNQVAGSYFETYETRMALGRSLDQNDCNTHAAVAVINQTLAGRYFPKQNPIGQFIELAGTRRIIGVVRDAKSTGRNLTSPVAPMVFTPFPTGPTQENFPGQAAFVVRTEGDPWLMTESIRQAVNTTDINLAVGDLHTQDQRMKSLFIGHRLFASVGGFIGVIALILAALGLFGLMSYSVVRRTGEIGVRMALGALPGQVQSMIVRESLSIVLVGAIAGIAASYAFYQLMERFLLGIPSSDPLTYVAVVSLILVVALVASWLPARRATKIDPIVALRSE